MTKENVCDNKELIKVAKDLQEFSECYASTIYGVSQNLNRNPESADAAYTEIKRAIRHGRSPDEIGDILISTFNYPSKKVFMGDIFLTTFPRELKKHDLIIFNVSCDGDKKPVTIVGELVSSDKDFADIIVNGKEHEIPVEQIDSKVIEVIELGSKEWQNIMSSIKNSESFVRVLIDHKIKIELNLSQVIKDELMRRKKILMLEKNENGELKEI